MFDRILFPTDGSETAADVFGFALDVAAAHDATVHVLNVADTSHDGVSRTGGADVIEALEAEGEEIVAALAERATDRSVPVETEVMQGRPYEAIGDYADAVAVDLVIMPTHGRSGVERFLLGSVTERVLNVSPVPVLTVTPDGHEAAYPCEDILVPTDGSPGSDAALTEAIALANATGATLHLLHVVETGSFGFDIQAVVGDDRFDEEGEEIVAAGRERAEAAGVSAVTTTVVHGSPVREILDYVGERGVDLVALGTRGSTDFSQYVLGGVSAKLLRSSPVPVLAVRGSD